MRGLLSNHIQNALQSLRSNRTRSYLTILGVAIGISSIVAVLALSAGANKIVSKQVDELGGNITIVRPGEPQTNPLSALTSTKLSRDFAPSSLTEYDIKTIRNIPEVQDIAPIMLIGGAIEADNVAPSDSLVVATTPDLAKISNLVLRDGQFFDETIDSNKAVIGPQLSINIFGTEQSIGKTFKFRGQTLTVIGVLKKLDKPINYNLVDFDNAAIISLDTSKEILGNLPQIQQINIRSDTVANLDKVIVTINKRLLENHRQQKDFSVLVGDQISQPTSQLFYTITGITTAVAAISLLVGGIGIMNIMLVNVAERTREIGIRKALGASNGDIAWQFIIESLSISIAGGAVGYLLGYMAAFGISSVISFTPVFNLEIAYIAFALSIIMGTLFGIYPAIRASRKDPIDSLRHFE